MISNERISGYLVEYDRDARDPERHAEKVWCGFDIIPAVWAYFLIDGALKTGGIIKFVWKEKPAFNEKKNEIQDVTGISAPPVSWVEYCKYEKNALEDWAGFCAEYENLKQTGPELVRSVIPFLERSVKSETPEYYLWYESTSDCGKKNLRGGLVPVGKCENPSSIKPAIESDIETRNKLQYNNIFECDIFDKLQLQIVPVEAVDVVCRAGEIRLSFIESFLARQGVAAPSLGLLAPSPAAPSLGTTTLPEIGQAELGELLWRCADGITKTADLLEQKIKPNTDWRERVAAFKQLKNKFPKSMQCRAEFWLQFCRPIGMDWKGVYEAETGRKFDLTGEDLKAKRSTYEKSIRAFHGAEYEEFKRQKNNR